MDLNKIDFKTVVFYLAKEGLEPSGEKEDAFIRLAAHYTKLRMKGADMAECDRCDQIGPVDFPECPFCGDKSQIIEVQAEGELFANELERALHLIRSRVDQISNNIYEVGKTMIRIVDDNLWQQKIGDDGKPFYDGAYECIEAETGYKRSAAKRLVSVAREYTAKEIEAHGVSRLDVSLRLPEKVVRRKFLNLAKAEQQVKGGKEDRILADKMLKESSIETPSEATSHAVTTTAKKEIVPVAPSTFRVRLKQGLATVPMYRRMAERDREATIARGIGDLPWCNVHLGKDVFLGIRIVRNDDGHIVALLDVCEGQHGSGSGTVTIGG